MRYREPYCQGKVTVSCIFIMTILIAIPKEEETGEARVAATPDTVKKYIALGCTVAVEKDAGAAANFPDDLYKTAGATIVKTKAELFKSANIILTVGIPSNDDVTNFKKDAILVGQLAPLSKDIQIRTKMYEKQKVTAFSLEKLPRISRAQSMDVLSSQANLSGYRAVIEAANLYARGFPMMMTAAGTVSPAKTFVMGAGVAGLQAIATARRLGAVVSATDVRAAAKEQVESLGATFVMVDLEDSETAGGYARELTKDEQKKQAELIAETLPKQDIVITTALIPGRPAPLLVTEDMVKNMKAGSIIVDMAAAMGGNCPLTKQDQVITTKNGVHIIGYTNLTSRIANDASALYARNLFNFVSLFLKKGDKSPMIEMPEDDELIISSKITGQKEDK